MTLLICWFLTLAEPYGLRFRQIIMCYYYPERAKQRAIWLYNHILRGRVSFLKFARRHLRKKNKNMIKFSCLLFLQSRVRNKFCASLLKKAAPDTQACLLCGDIKTKTTEENFISCSNYQCNGFFCKDCYKDMKNTCTMCKLPIEYDDLSDISEEKDSSDEDFQSKDIRGFSETSSSDESTRITSPKTSEDIVETTKSRKKKGSFSDASSSSNESENENVSQSSEDEKTTKKISIEASLDDETITESKNKSSSSIGTISSDSKSLEELITTSKISVTLTKSLTQGSREVSETKYTAESELISELTSEISSLEISETLTESEKENTSQTSFNSNTSISLSSNLITSEIILSEEISKESNLTLSDKSLKPSGKRLPSTSSLRTIESFSEPVTVNLNSFSITEADNSESIPLRKSPRFYFYTDSSKSSLPKSNSTSPYSASRLTSSEPAIDSGDSSPLTLKTVNSSESINPLRKSPRFHFQTISSQSSLLSADNFVKYPANNSPRDNLKDIEKQFSFEHASYSSFPSKKISTENSEADESSSEDSEMDASNSDNPTIIRKKSNESNEWDSDSSQTNLIQHDDKNRKTETTNLWKRLLQKLCNFGQK